MTEYAKVSLVATRGIGTNLLGEHPAGSTEILVSDRSDFGEDGGTLVIDGIVYAYAAWTGDAEDDSLELATATTVVHEDGARVLISPATTETIATVVIDGEGEGLEVEVPHTLIDKLPDGPRDTDTAETVELEDTDAGWVLVDIVKETPTVDAGFLTGELPQVILDQLPLPSDGLPPATSPAVKVIDALGSLMIRWDVVDNQSPVTYDVHVVAGGDTGFVVSGATLQSSLEGGFIAYRGTLPNGVPLTPEATYSARIVARDADGAADPGTGDSTTLRLIQGPDVKTGSLTADLLASTIILVSDLFGGDYDFDASEWVGGHWEATRDGIRLFDVTGRKTVDLPTDPSIAALFEGGIVARFLTVEDFLALRGENNEFSKGSVTTLATGTTAPQSSPQPSIGWPVKPRTFGSSLTAGQIGFAKDGASWWVVSSFFGGFLDRFTEGSGSFTPQVAYSLGSWFHPTGVTAFNGWVYVLGRDERDTVGGFGKFFVRRYSASTGAHDSTWQYQPSGTTTGLYSNLDPSITNDGTKLLIAQCDNSAGGDSEVIIRRYTTGGSLEATLSTGVILNDHVSSINIGTFDLGASTYIITGRSKGTAYSVRSATQTPVSAENFPLPKSSGIVGMVWDGTVFRSLSDDGVHTHSQHQWTSSAQDRWWIAHSWFRRTATQYETQVSKRVSFLMKKRAHLTVTTAPLPAATGSPTDVTGIRVYHGKGATTPLPSAMMRSNVDIADGATSVTYSGPLVLSVAANTGTPGPFPASTPAIFQSSDGVLKLMGDGTAQGRDPIMPNDFVTKRVLDLPSVASVGLPNVSPFGSSVTLRKAAGVVYLTGNFSRSSGFSASFTAAGVVPVGFRPISTVTINGTFFNSTTTWTVDFASNGDISIRMSAANSTSMTVGGYAWLAAP